MRVDLRHAMRSLARTIAFLGLLALCWESKQESPKRVELTKVPGGLVELVPKEGADTIAWSSPSPRTESRGSSP